MKQGTLATKIIMLVILCGVVAYLGVYAIRSMSDPYDTDLAYSYTVEKAITSTGYLVRNEEVLTPVSGLINLLPSEGEKVAAKQTIATVYQDENALKKQQELSEASNQLDQLEALAKSSEESMDKAKLNEEIVSALYTLRAAVSSQSLSNVNSLSTELKSLVFKRDYSFGNEKSIQDMITQTSQKVDALKQEASQNTRTITVSHSGTFSGLVDGYESALTVKSLDTMNPSDFASIPSQKAAQNSGNQIGKLISGTTWYFVTVLPSKNAENLTEGRAATLRFARDFTQSVTMTIRRISNPENGKVLVVFSCDKYLSQITLLRSATADIIFDSHSGLRIPKDAVRVKEDGTVGVYCVTGVQAEFKKVDIAYEGDTFYLVKVDATNPDGLRANDEVIVVGDDMYSGKVMQKMT